MAFRRRNFGVRDRVSNIDRTNVAIAVAGLILALVVVLPRVYPAAQHGIACSDLASPLGGNNRSVLAQSGGDAQTLDLALQLEADAIAPGEPLQVRVTFVNRDIGPMILYLPESSPITNRNNVLVLDITQADNSLLGDPNTNPPTVPATFQLEELHLLGSRARCSEQFEISAAELSSLGLVPGSEYRIEATYRIPQDGNPQPLQPTNATATMAYPTSQGVWTGDVSSDDVSFTMLQTGAVPP